MKLMEFILKENLEREFDDSHLHYRISYFLLVNLHFFSNGMYSSTRQDRLKLLLYLRSLMKVVHL